MGRRGMARPTWVIAASTWVGAEWIVRRGLSRRRRGSSQRVDVGLRGMGRRHELRGRFSHRGSKLSSKSSTSRTPSKIEASSKIQPFFQDSNFKNITCFASSNQARSKGIIQEQDQGSNVAQSILKQLIESPKAGIVIKENPLYDNSDSASSKSKKEAHPDVMSVVMADITAEAAMVEMERKINFLMKAVEERDHEITALREQMRTRETIESSQTPVVKATDKGKNVVQENQPQLQSVSDTSLSIQQLQDMIANSIRAQYGGQP
ncbi:ty3-gypsy retrotransposon protein [Cucumis melo var. makuwa]|uniref:Ty3-gypsy retrotransposon protein n=2 Tax=Cucumis melo TaxID=3656 RepID=A0A5A7UG56_CUCMM|nr:ty3-gypsy retrotransposon protein [Cucumis melo var. makuwa]